MSRQSAHGIVVASTTVSAVLALCMVGLGATAPAAASSLTSSTTADAGATSLDIAAAIGASLDAGSQAGARTGGGFARSFAASATASSSTGLGVDTGAALTAYSSFAVPTLSVEPGSLSSPAPIPAATSLMSNPSSTTQAASLTAPPAVTSGATVNAPPKAHVVVVSAMGSSPRQIGQSLAASLGWTGAQWTCLSSLWQRESLFRTTARNYKSGAYGIPQALPASKMATAGADWRTNPATQIRWGLQYIAGRYGNPCSAWAHWKTYRSY